MHTARTIRSTLIAVGCAAVLTGPALAGGEPKNALPFTQVNIRAKQATANSTVKPEPIVTGEAKNESPFTRPVAVAVQSSSALTSKTRRP